MKEGGLLSAPLQGLLLLLLLLFRLLQTLLHRRRLRRLRMACAAVHSREGE